jgi:hypothetical protein
LSPELLVQEFHQPRLHRLHRLRHLPDGERGFLRSRVDDFC